MKDIYLGVKHFINASSYLFNKKLLHYYLWPIVVAILFYVGITSLILMFSGQISDWLLTKYFPNQENVYTGSYTFLKFLSSFSLKHVATFIIGLLMFMISGKISKYVVLILLSPLFSLLSEKVEEIENNTIYPFNVMQFLKDILRGSLLAIRNLFIELFLIGVFTIVGFFSGPFAVLVVPLLWLVSAYFYGFSMIDYTCERKKMSIKEGIQYIRKHRMFAIGIGSMYLLVELIPVIGMIIAPINGVVGATTGILEIEKGNRHLL
jgi:CysZ protein